MALFFSRAFERVFAAGADGGTGTWICFHRFLGACGGIGICTLRAEWLAGGGIAAISGVRDAVMDLVVRLSSSCGCDLLVVFVCTLGSDCLTCGSIASPDTFSLAVLRIDCNMLISLLDVSFVALCNAF